MAKIHYLQHAHSIGGAVISLRNLVDDALAHGHACEVTCPNDAMAGIYRGIGAAAVVRTIVGFNHTTADWYRANPYQALRGLKALARSAWSCLGWGLALRRSRPDIVHLNSSTLGLYALTAKALGFAVVWHVRENVARGHLGMRRALLRMLMNATADRIVCIGEKERDLIRTRPSKTDVIYNYVHIGRFQEYRPEASEQSPGAGFAALSLGGMSKIKGTSTLLRTAPLLRPDEEIWIVGDADPEGRDRYTGNAGAATGPEGERLLERNLRVYPPCLDVRPYLFRCDVLIFWGTVPHFARPVYEAWAMGKPSIVLNTCAGGDIDGDTALLVEEDDPRILAAALAAVRADYPSHLAKAALGRRRAALRFGEANYERIESIYAALTRRSGSAASAPAISGAGTSGSLSDRLKGAL